MKKIVIPKEESPNLQTLMRDFCLAKQAVYNYDLETYEKKVKNFEENIKSLALYTNPFKFSNALGKFSCRTGQISAFMDSPINDFSNINIKYIIHELNHAWNYEKGKRCNIFLLPIKFSDYKKYLYIMEAINEAETQILCSETLKKSDISYDSKLGEFTGSYKIFEESIFKTLCILCNQNGTDFLRNIEGMNINQLILYISQNTGYSIYETTNYIDKLGLFHYALQNSYNNFYSEHTSPFLDEVLKIFIKELDKSCRNLKLQNLLDDWLNKNIQIKDYIPEYQKIYEHSKEFIVGISTYSKKEKNMALLNFENIQDNINLKIISSFYKIAKIVDNANILKTHPNLKVVEHVESINPIFNTFFELGKINSPDLIDNTDFQFPWNYRQENEVQKSLKRKKIFSRVTISSLRNIRKFLEQDLIKDLREGRQI